MHQWSLVQKCGLIGGVSLFFALLSQDGSELPLKEAGTGESVHSLLSIMEAIVGQPNTFKHVFARAARDTYVLQ